MAYSESLAERTRAACKGLFKEKPAPGCKKTDKSVQPGDGEPVTHGAPEPQAKKPETRAKKQVLEGGGKKRNAAPSAKGDEMGGGPSRGSLGMAVVIGGPRRGSPTIAHTWTTPVSTWCDFSPNGGQLRTEGLGIFSSGASPPSGVEVEPTAPDNIAQASEEKEEEEMECNNHLCRHDHISGERGGGLTLSWVPVALCPKATCGAV
uniref:Uncharacterized protein n=1 Tax=Sphaerodactylus townsendi TaxID=933632 RepID=A0ACB8FQZ5_9SAUR